ncbi:MAG TPA: hypothetical protein VD772_12290, partial [Anseongella sp.]|nr:hypothetical protein [Anseongella sp.]
MRPEYLLKLKTTSLLAAVSLVLLIATPATAQYFGRNHVQYERFDFEMLETNHFDIYHYLDNDTTINDFALMSERWYFRHQE